MHAKRENGALRHASHAVEGTYAVEVERVLFVDEPSRGCNREMTKLSVYTLPGGRRDCAMTFATQDWQEDRNTGRDQGYAVNEELRPVLSQPVSHTAYYT